MTRRVVGLDLSLTRTGIAIIVEHSRGHRLITDTITSKGTRKANLPDRHTRLSTLAADILHHASRATLVIVEGCVAVAGGSMLDRHALWWLVVGGCIHRDIPVAVIAPTSLKKAITDNGRADKVEVALAVQKLWPDSELGNNDTADAAGLAHLGAVHLGWDIPTLARHRAVQATEWPLFPEPTEKTGPQIAPGASNPLGGHSPATQPPAASERQSGQAKQGDSAPLVPDPWDQPADPEALLPLPRLEVSR